MRRFITVFGTGLMLAVLVLAGPTWADAPIPYSVQPTDGSPGSERGYFDLSAEPGTQVRLALSVSNRSTKTIRVLIAATDAATGPHGGVSYGVAGEPVERTGSWIVLPQDSVRLGGKETATVPFVVTVPNDAASGDHVAGIAAWIPAEEKDAPESEAGQAGASITVQMRQVVPVKIVVPGPAQANLVVTGVTAVAGADKIDLDIAIANQGGLLVRGSGTISLKDGHGGFEQAFELDTVVPGTSLAYSVPWDATPKAGSYPVDVVLRYGDQEPQIARWSGDVVVGEKSLETLEDRQDGEASTAVATPATTTSWLVYGLVGGLLVVIVVMGILLLRRRKLASRT